MLAEIRKQKGLSQEKLAELSGVSIRVIRALEQGTRDINKAQSQTIYFLSQALSCRIEDLIMRTVINKNGKEIDFEASVEMMVDEIREELHNELSPCSDQVFLSAYEKAHEEKYGEWELSKENPTW